MNRTKLDEVVDNIPEEKKAEWDKKIDKVLGIDPGKTYDYTSPECNRRSCGERRDNQTPRVKIGGILHYSDVKNFRWLEDRRTGPKDRRTN